MNIAACDAFMGIFGMTRVIDKNVESVRQKLMDRAITGHKKYGCTTERTDLTNKQWLIHAQEEAMDFCIYLEKLIGLEKE